MSLPLIFFIGLIISCLITPLVIYLYRQQNWLDDPNKNRHIKKTHQTPTPRGGGIPIFISFLIGSLLFLQIDKYLIALTIAALFLTIVGVLDDILDLHPYIRLIAGLAAGLIVVGSGIGIAFVSNPFGPGVIHLNEPTIILNLFNQTRTIWVIADIFALFFILWNMNIVNWSKGVDGQLPAFSVVAFIVIGLIGRNFFSADPTEFNNALMSFLLAGAFTGLLIFNWYPQKIMPGYGGGSLAGFFLAVLAILSGAKIATTLMVLAIPTADALYTIARRIISKKSPIWGDRGHLHHQLLDTFGWSRQKVAIFYALSSLVLGILALNFSTLGKIIALVFSFLLVFIIQTWSRIKRAQQKSFNI
jgi:UDP-GlcNAc:undecaprenyl-phosphate GlcNAc-1-phosphate transferase